MSILEVVIGAVVSIVITIVVEYIRRPKLVIKIADPVDREFENHPAKRARFLYLILKNKPLLGLFSWMLRETAVQCHGEISFHYLDDGQDVFGRSMAVRWSGTPEPSRTTLLLSDGTRLVIQPGREAIETVVDIPAGEAESLDVAGRFEDEPECYGWSNENYFSEPQWRHPDWQLKTGRYLVKVTIVSAGQRTVGVFRLLNEGRPDTFRLTNPMKGDVARISEGSATEKTGGLRVSSVGRGVPGKGIGQPSSSLARSSGSEIASGSKLVILEAKWRYGDASADVTEWLRSAIVGDRLEIRATNEALGCTDDRDPAPGDVKQLDVTYSYAGKVERKSVGETKMLSLP